MQPFRQLIPFDRPLAGAVVVGQELPVYTESQYAKARAEAYQAGQDAARSFAEKQLAEFRGEVQALQHGLFYSMTQIEANMVHQLQAGLPELAMDIARRLLAGFEPDADLVAKLCEEALKQLYPERENLQLVVCPRDAELLRKMDPAFMHQYPGLTLKADVTLRPGDSQVRSRFGLTDARLDAKMAAIQHELGMHA
jgi:flagellar assembly protein FliH